MAANAKVKSDINELKKITAEISKLNELAKPLRQRKKELEAALLTYMNTSKKNIELPDVEVVSIEKSAREKLDKDEKEYSAVQLLEQSGIQNAKKVYYDLQEVLKGKETTTRKLKLKDKKK